MTNLPVETYKQIRSEQTEAFSDPKQLHNLLFWAMNQLRKTARTVDLLDMNNGTFGTSRTSNVINWNSAIPDVTADVIENVLRVQGFKMRKTTKKHRHWFDNE